MTNIKNIDPSTLKKWLDNNEAILIDVREMVEHKSCSIPDAKNIPLAQVEIDKILSFWDKGKKLVFHCKSGKRSLMACEKIANKDIDFDVYSLQGGIDSWKSADLSTISKVNLLPLERQTQITISFIILSGLGLYYFLQNPLYLFLPLIAGLGLLNAGLTGWCGMAKLIAKMPWNK